MENNDLLKSQLEVNDVVASHLYETAKWGKFLAIVGFILCGLFVLVGIYFVAAKTSLSAYDSSFAKLGPAIGFVYILLALINFFPCLFLIGFCTKIKAALASSDQQTFTEAFDQHRRMYKYIGIVAIVIISLYVLGIIVAIAGASFR